MELIILNDGLYQLIPVTKQMMEHISLLGEVSCMDVCDIIREKLTVYDNNINKHLLKDGSVFFGCVCN